MRHHELRALLLLGGIATLAGCGSVQEVIVDAVRTSAKEAVEEAVDDTVDGLVDEILGRLPDFEGLIDLEGIVSEDDGKSPDE